MGVKMNIEVIKEDILKIQEGIVCHQVNCMGAAGGLAGAIFRKYPAAQQEYKITVQSFVEDWLPLGTVNLVNIDDKLFVANLFAQYEYGTESRKTEYGTFRMCLRDLVGAARFLKKIPKTIYFPYGIGCGLGGGNWEIIRGIIKYELVDYDFKVVICHKD